MAIDAGYVASQNNRWVEANKKGDQDLMNRLIADSKRVGYELKPYQPAQSTPAKTTQVNSVTNTTPISTQTKTNISNPLTETLERFNQQLSKNTNFTTPQPFKYDYKTDPQYQAALENAKRNIESQQRDTNAILRSQGQGKSSFSETLANQIGSKEMGRVQTDVIPALVAQAYQKYADDANRQMQIQQMNYGAMQDQLSNLERLYSMQDQQYFQNPLSEAQVTGNYLSGEARQYINAINQLKSQAETPGITKQERDALSSQADAYRRALQGLGVDSTLFGANVNLATAQGNANRAGIRTLQGQNLDEGIRQYNQNFDYGVQRDAIGDQQWQQELARALANDANSRSLGWANHNLSAQREARLTEQERAAQSGQTTGTSSKPANYKYTNDPSFQSAVTTINSANENTLRDLMFDVTNNPQVYIDQFGFDGYENYLKRLNDRQKTLDAKNKNTNPFTNSLLNRG